MTATNDCLSSGDISCQNIVRDCCSAAANPCHSDLCHGHGCVLPAEVWQTCRDPCHDHDLWNESPRSCLCFCLRVLCLSLSLCPSLSRRASLCLSLCLCLCLCLSCLCFSSQSFRPCLSLILPPLMRGASSFFCCENGVKAIRSFSESAV